MLWVPILLALITIIVVFFYDKKGSIAEMERYYQDDDHTCNKFSSNDEPSKTKNL